MAKASSWADETSPLKTKRYAKDEFIENASILEEIQANYTTRPIHREENTQTIKTLEDFEKYFSGQNSATSGFALCDWCEDAIDHEILGKLKVTPRCIPLDSEKPDGNCIFTGKPAPHKVIFAKAY